MKPYLILIIKLFLHLSIKSRRPRGQGIAISKTTNNSFQNCFKIVFQKRQTIQDCSQYESYSGRIRYFKVMYLHSNQAHRCKRCRAHHGCNSNYPKCARNHIVSKSIRHSNTDTMTLIQAPGI